MHEVDGCASELKFKLGPEDTYLFVEHPLMNKPGGVRGKKHSQKQKGGGGGREEDELAGEEGGARQEGSAGGGVG